MKNQNSRKFISSKEGDVKDGDKSRKGSLFSRSKIISPQPETPKVDSRTIKKNKQKDDDESMFERDEQQVQVEQEFQYYQDNPEKYLENPNMQLNYFVFEMQVRKRMKEIVDPLFTFNLEFKQSIEEFKINSADFSKRLQFIEGVFQEGQGKNVVFDKVMEQCRNGEIERLKFHSQFQQIAEKLTERQNKLEFTVDNHQTKLDSDNKQIENIYDQIKSIRSDMISQVEQSNIKIDKMNYQIDSQIQNIIIKLQTNNDLVQTVYQNLEDRKSQLDQCVSRLNKMQYEQVPEIQINISKIEQSCSKESEQIRKFTEIEKMFIQVEYALQDLRNRILTCDLYIESYLPHRQNLLTIKILQNFYNAVDGPQKNAFESQKLKNDGPDKQKVLMNIVEQQQKELVLKLIKIEDNKQSQPNFRKQMQVLDEVLSEKFPEIFQNKNKMTSQELSRLKMPIVQENASLLRGEFDINESSNFVIIDQDKKKERQFDSFGLPNWPKPFLQTKIGQIDQETKKALSFHSNTSNSQEFVSERRNYQKMNIGNLKSSEMQKLMDDQNQQFQQLLSLFLDPGKSSAIAEEKFKGDVTNKLSVIDESLNYLKKQVQILSDECDSPRDSKQKDHHHHSPLKNQNLERVDEQIQIIQDMCLQFEKKSDKNIKELESKINFLQNQQSQTINNIFQISQQISQTKSKKGKDFNNLNELEKKINFFQNGDKNKDQLYEIQQQIEQVAKFLSVLVESYFISQTVQNQEKIDLQKIIDTIINSQSQMTEQLNQLIQSQKTFKNNISHNSSTKLIGDSQKVVLNAESNSSSALNMIQQNNRKDLLKKRNISMNYRKNSNVFSTPEESGYVFIGVEEFEKAKQNKDNFVKSDNRKNSENILINEKEESSLPIDQNSSIQKKLSDQQETQQQDISKSGSENQNDLNQSKFYQLTENKMNENLKINSATLSEAIQSNEISSPKIQLELALKSQNSTLKGLIDEQDSSGHHLTPKLANDQFLNKNQTDFGFLSSKVKNEKIEDIFQKIYNQKDIQIINQLKLSDEQKIGLFGLSKMTEELSTDDLVHLIKKLQKNKFDNKILIFLKEKIAETAKSQQITKNENEKSSHLLIPLKNQSRQYNSQQAILMAPSISQQLNLSQSRFKKSSDNINSVAREYQKGFQRMLLSESTVQKNGSTMVYRKGIFSIHQMNQLQFIMLQEAWNQFAKSQNPFNSSKVLKQVDGFLENISIHFQDYLDLKQLKSQSKIDQNIKITNDQNKEIDQIINLKDQKNRRSFSMRTQSQSIHSAFSKASQNFLIQKVQIV